MEFNSVFVTCCNRLEIKDGRSSSSGSVEEGDVFFISISMLHRQINERQQTIRYNFLLTGHDQMLEYIYGHKERVFN